MSPTCNPKQIIEPGGRKLQALRGHMRVPVDHCLSFPTAEALQFPRGSTRLPVPCGKGMAQVMPAEILDARSFQGLPPRARADLHDGAPFVCEDMGRAVTFAPFQHRHGHCIERHGMGVAVLVLLSGNPEVLTLRTDPLPLKASHTPLPQPCRHRELRQVFQVRRKFREQSSKLIPRQSPNAGLSVAQHRHLRHRPMISWSNTEPTLLPPLSLQFVMKPQSYRLLGIPVLRYSGLTVPRIRENFIHQYGERPVPALRPLQPVSRSAKRKRRGCRQ